MHLVSIAIFQMIQRIFCFLLFNFLFGLLLMVRYAICFCLFAYLMHIHTENMMIICKSKWKVSSRRKYWIHLIIVWFWHYIYKFFISYLNTLLKFSKVPFCALASGVESFCAAFAKLNIICIRRVCNAGQNRYNQIQIWLHSFQ